MFHDKRAKSTFSPAVFKQDRARYSPEQTTFTSVYCSST
jgi:hypothetical protein